jgi:hypothetical protein
MNEAEKKLKRYRVNVFMVKPFEFVDVWGKKPDVDDVLEAFSGELLTERVTGYFKIEVYEA